MDHCWQGRGVALDLMAICRLPATTGTLAAWKATSERKFSSWRTCRNERPPLATEAALSECPASRQGGYTCYAAY